jgi:hypothetical protein
VVKPATERRQQQLETEHPRSLRPNAADRLVGHYGLGGLHHDYRFGTLRCVNSCGVHGAE